MNIKLLSEYAVAPTRGSEEAAGYDLYSAYNCEIKPGETVKIPTDIAIELPKNTFGGIFARSGLATKQGLRPANCVGVIDSDYRGNIIVAIHNDSSESHFINIGDRIAQLIILPYYVEPINIVDELDSTERGAGGFGSTGTN